MLSLTEIKVGTKIVLESDPCEILWRQHSKIGRGGAVLRTKLRNLRTGSVISKTFQGNEMLPEADLSFSKAQYLYNEGEGYYFMDEKTYDQFSLSKKQLGESVNFLKESTTVNILIFNDDPINLDLPVKIDLKVVEAPPAFRGNTADGGSKRVKLETGYYLAVPFFIKSGDIVRVNTREGIYVERV